MPPRHASRLFALLQIGSGLAVATVALVIDARDRSPIVRRLVCPFGAPAAR